MSAQICPIYSKMKAEGDKLGRAPWLAPADCAALIRYVLKGEFPGVKFSVRSKSYSGGSSVSVDWVDGPTREMVENICDQYSGRGFDGSIDMAYTKDVFILPNGRAICAAIEGTAGSGGYVEQYRAFMPSADAIRVNGSSWIQCSRSHSFDHMSRAVAAYARKYKDPLGLAIEAGEIGVIPVNKWDGWDFIGPIESIASYAPGHQYGARSALSQFAARRMVAPARKG